MICVANVEELLQIKNQQCKEFDGNSDIVDVTAIFDGPWNSRNYSAR